jgi:hypothetical protein
LHLIPGWAATSDDVQELVREAEASAASLNIDSKGVRD